MLRNLDQYVTAVDPGALDERLASDKGIRHKRMTAEAYLRDEPDTFDIIVNDMRMDARDSARLMVAYARQLQRGGVVIMTLKLPETGRSGVIQYAFTVLKQAYKIEGARQLFHNRSEITVQLRLLRYRKTGSPIQQVQGLRSISSTELPFMAVLRVGRLPSL